MLARPSTAHARLRRMSHALTPRRTAPIVASTLLALSLSARSASAQDAARARGVEASAALGATLIPGGLPPMNGPLALVAESHLGFRVARRVAFGALLQGHFLGDSRNGADDATTLLAGIYLRVHVAPHPERPGWDPWFALELIPIARTLGTTTPPGGTFSGSTPPRASEGRSVAASLRLGLDRRLSERLAVGVSFSTSVWRTVDVCNTVETASGSSRACAREAPSIEEFGVVPPLTLSFAVSLHARYTLPL